MVGGGGGGGVFERMIQTTKRCLRKTIGCAQLTYEELLTVTIEVEMTLNSRPLSYVSSEDLEEPLTPSHLLCGHRVLSLPDPAIGEDAPDCTATCCNLTRQIQHLSKILTDFWKRWRSEYLLELRDMHHHSRSARGVNYEISVGNIVVVHDENLPRGLWRLGKVEELIVGADGNVRCARVRISSPNRSPISVKRSLQRLYPLELSSDDGYGETDKQQEDQTDLETATTALDVEQDGSPAREPEVESTCPRRQGFRRAQDTLRAWCKDL